MPEDFDPFPDVSPEQARAIFAQMMTTSALDNVDTMPEVKVDDDGGDKCCAEAKSKWLSLIDGSLEDSTPDGIELSNMIRQSYENMSCEEFRDALENIAGIKNTDKNRYPFHNKHGGRTMESRHAEHVLGEWNKCEFGASEDAEDMGFYASADPFEYSWNMIIKGLGGFER